MSNPFTESDRERMSKWCEHPDGSVPYNAICRLFDSHETLRAELTAKEKALSSAKIALDAKDRSYSVIEQRFSAMAAKAATTDSERECNERLTAEIDALTAELTEARRQLKEATQYARAIVVALHRNHYAESSPNFEPFDSLDGLLSQIDNMTTGLVAAPVPQPAVPDDVAKDASDKLALAYGYLWHVNNMRPGYDAPVGHSRQQLTPEKAAYKARAVLRELLTNDQRGDGINRADAILSATDSEVGK